ncbi:MAG: hypothetical protein ACE5GN_01605 [Waddliaceae bacterium]
MKVVSPAGDFEIKVIKADVEGKHIVVRGEMGVWDSKIYISPGDLWQFISIILRPRVVLFLLASPFRVLYETLFDKGGKVDEEDGEK